MNWTEGTLYRHSRGRLRKTNPARQRQKEYFARARLRFAQQRETPENGPLSALPRPPPRSSPALSRHSHASRRSRSSSAAQTPQRETHRQVDASRKRPRVPSVSNEPRPPPSISRYFDKLSSKSGTTEPAAQHQYDAEALERMRQRVLSRDWGTGKLLRHAPAPKRPHISPRKPTEDIPDTRNDTTHPRDPAHDRQDRREDPRIRKLQRDDVKIRVGSQEKRLWQTSTADTATLDRSTADRDRLSMGIPRELSPSLPQQKFGLVEDNIHCPVPVRVVQLHSMGHADSTNAGSAVAEVGRPVSPVPASQMANNTVWRKWLAPSTTTLNTSKAVEGSRESMAAPKISPGVSGRYRQWSEESQSLPLLTDNSPAVSPEPESGETRDLANLPSSSETSQILLKYSQFLSKYGEAQGEDLDDEEHTPVADSVGSFPPRHATQDDVSGSETRAAMADAHIGQTDLDPEDAWKAFVFGSGDTDEAEEQALSDARHEAAQNLRPSEPPTCTPENSPLSESDSNIAAAGTVYTNEEAVSETTYGMSSSPSAPESQEVTFAPSSAAELSDHSSSGQVPSEQDASIEADAGSHVFSEDESGTDEPGDHDPISSDDIAGTTPEVARRSPSPESSSESSSVVASMAVEAAQSEFAGTEQSFRFAPPKLFVGRSFPTEARKPAAALTPLSFAKPKRGRPPKKRARDGRANIRALPNYNGDPIEEMEDDVSPPSRFPALELD
ncbi:hypothetical protein QBC39DRAFT_299111 [Podospora conica]|nr:hypothetical protein QBC39DRAFT_299111 [Schizothecium conicum]